MGIQVNSGITLQRTNAPAEPSQTAPQPSVRETTTARNGTPLAGAEISVSPLTKEQAAQASPQAGQSRLAKIGNGLAAALGGAAGSVAVLASAAAMPFALGAAKLADKFSPALKEARQQAQTQMQQLGTPAEQSVLNRQIPTENFGEVSVGQVMEQYRLDLGSGVSAGQMRSYIAMGERIMDALNNAGSDYQGGAIEVKDADGQTHKVEPNLQSARAVSWFMQAKGVADNASADRDPVVLNRGSMVAKDPSGTLFKFLGSAPNTYGRASTHFNERGASGKANFSNTGVAGALAGLNGQGAQLGIEDYGNGLPSGGGCMVFDKLNGKDGEQQIYLKWESSGMPTFFGKSRHADKADGATDAVINKFKSPFRCMKHAMNFLNSLRPTTPQKWGVHREAVDKGEVKALFSDFEAQATSFGRGFDKGDDWGKVVTKEAKHHGLHFMADSLSRMAGEYEQQTGTVPAGLTNLQQKITEFGHSMGADFGIERKGMELHTSLDTGYLTQA